MQIRQGDILLEKIGKLPSGLKEKDKILAQGEVTGHCHQFTSPNAKVMVTNNGQQFCELSAPCKLQHEEHAVITIPKGFWRIINAREYDSVEGVRSVLD